MLATPQKLENRLSKRLDADKMIFSPRLNPSQMDALRNAQTAEAIRLQQFHQSIRNLEAAIAARRVYLVTRRNADHLSHLFGCRKPRLTRAIEKVAATVDRRSLREMQNLLFKLKRQYHEEHKRYAQRHGFHSYTNRIAIAYRHQNTL